MKFILRLGLALLTGLSQSAQHQHKHMELLIQTLRSCVSQNLFNRHLTTGCVTHGQH